MISRGNQIKFSLLGIAFLILGLGFFSRYHINSADTVPIKNRLVVAIINTSINSVAVNIETLCKSPENSREAIFIDVNGRIPINDDDLELLWIESDSNGMQIIMNEARQSIYYFADSKQNQNAVGYELNRAPIRPSTTIDATILIYPTQIRKIDQIVVESYNQTDSLERRNHAITAMGERGGRCIKEIKLGTQTELLKNLTISIGIGEYVEATNTKLILIVRSLILLFLLTLVYIYKMNTPKAQKNDF
jgi:hypothetical protein